MLENIRLGCKLFSGTNALAYFGFAVSDEEIKLFMGLTPGVNVIKLFFFVANDEAKQARVFARGKNFPV